uniref:Uncharacterized protein n=1 Tax=Rhizophora mucronata TaxID=61149 RepID=A0A2P2MKX2_RHIMU
MLNFRDENYVLCRNILEYNSVQLFKSYFQDKNHRQNISVKSFDIDYLCIIECQSKYTSAGKIQIWNRKGISHS